ncbi:hypothetical protein PQX77_018764 [Marasmius sp. AFHP31]|nr:hypothetical protein PQX77_018764 [Marasmius sp. AFHP31]
MFPTEKLKHATTFGTSTSAVTHEQTQLFSHPSRPYPSPHSLSIFIRALTTINGTLGLNTAQISKVFFPFTPPLSFVREAFEKIPYTDASIAVKYQGQHLRRACSMILCQKQEDRLENWIDDDRSIYQGQGNAMRAGFLALPVTPVVLYSQASPIHPSTTPTSSLRTRKVDQEGWRQNPNRAVVFRFGNTERYHETAQSQRH